MLKTKQDVCNWAQVVYPCWGPSPILFFFFFLLDFSAISLLEKGNMEYSKTGYMNWNCILLLFQSSSGCKTGLLSNKHHARSWMYVLYFQLSCYVTLNISLNLLTHGIVIWTLITITGMPLHLWISCHLWSPHKCLVGKDTLWRLVSGLLWDIDIDRAAAITRQTALAAGTKLALAWVHPMSNLSIWCSEFGIEVSNLCHLKCCVNFLRITEQNDSEQASRPTECIWM